MISLSQSLIYMNFQREDTFPSPPPMIFSFFHTINRINAWLYYTVYNF